MKNSISVLFIHTSIVGGGAEKVVYSLYQYLRDKCNVEFVSIKDRNEIGSGDHRLTNLSYSGTLVSSFTLYRLIKEKQPVIVFTTIGQVSLLINIIRFLGGFKFNHVVRLANIREGKNVYTKLLKRLFIVSLKQVTCIIVQTPKMRDYVVNTWNIDRSKVFFARNYLNVDVLKQKAVEYVPQFRSKINIISLGRITEVKGYELALEAIHSLVNDGYEISYHILGKYSEKDIYFKSMNDYVVKYDLQNHISFLGFIKNPYPYMKNGNILLLSSHAEGFPNVVIESLCLGTPVVVTDCSDFAGIIREGMNGFIVEKNNFQALAEGLRKGLTLKKGFDFQYENFDYEEFFTGLCKE